MEISSSIQGLVLCAGILAITQFESSSGLICVNCISDEHIECQESFPLNLDAMDLSSIHKIDKKYRHLFKDCGDSANAQCEKYEVRAYRMEREVGGSYVSATRITRGCSESGYKDQCWLKDSATTAASSCFCGTNGCNHGNHLKPTFFTIATAALVLMTSLLSVYS